LGELLVGQVRHEHCFCCWQDYKHIFSHITMYRCPGYNNVSA
jgi:hypothetical protein